MLALVDTFLVSTRRKVDTSEQGVRHRRWTIEQKQKIVIETFECGASVPRVAQQYALNPNLVFKWRKQYREGRLKNGAATSGLLPVKVSDEALIEAADPEHVDSRAPAGTIEIQLPKGRLQITGRVDLLALRTAIACLVP
jgi:transposase